MEKEISEKDFPSVAKMKWAMLVVLLDYENSGLVANEIDKKASKLLGLSEELFEYVTPSGKKYFTYRLGWERTKAKKQGFIERVPNAPRMWRLTAKGISRANLKAKTFKQIASTKNLQKKY
jgi:restriction endonuclease Mrr